MKGLKKICLLLALCLTLALVFVGCAPPPEPGPIGDDGGTLATGVATAKVTGSYTTPIKISYSNMRPTYNMYTTTSSYQMLTTYEDGTYCFIVSSSAGSALDIVWSEEDAGAKCNPRATKLTAFYGEYTTAAADGATTDITLAKAFRIIVGEVNSSGDILYCVDTDNWPDENSRRPNATADGYRLATAWNTMTVSVNTSSNSFSESTLTVAAAAQRELQTRPATPTTVTPGPAFAKTIGSYFTLTDRTMGFEKYSDTSYRVAFSYQMLLLYEGGSYCLFQSTAVANNLWLAAAGNNLNTGTDAANSHPGKTGVEFTQYYGNYITEDNGFDDSLLNVTIRKALRVVSTRTIGGSLSGTGNNVTTTAESGYYADTLNWTSGMGTSTGKTAETYLAQEGFETSLVFAVKIATTSPNSSFAFLEKDASGQMQPLR